MTRTGMHRRLRRIIRHPAAGFVLTSVLCLTIKENFPFSNFPMYSWQKAETDYYYLTDSAGRPLPTRRVTDLTTTRIKKMMGQELQRIAKERRMSRGDLPVEDRRLAAERVLRHIRELGLYTRESTRSSRTPMDGDVGLVWVRISLRNGDIQKTPLELARN